MMDLRGQRFTLDLSDDKPKPGLESSFPSNGCVRDVQERPISYHISAPSFKSNSTGFPEHKKRTGVSAFKLQRDGSRTANPVVRDSSNIARPVQKATRFEQIERQQIDEDNRRRLTAMSADEVEEERRELFSQIDPSLLERLLKRVNLDDGRGDTGIESTTSRVKERESAGLQQVEGGVEGRRAQKETNSEEDQVEAQKKEAGVPAAKPAGRPVTDKSIIFVDEDEPMEPIGLQPTSAQPIKIDTPSIHFPIAPSVPDLDPSDPSFLENLHQKYFPSLPADPAKLAWMAPIPSHGSVADQESSYYPAHRTIAPSALRFDFRGGILPPRISRAMPSTKGLHHHGDAPEAAGYTVPELARLMLSAFPAQRCIAFQTLGRLLYRLGRGEWGDDESELVKGLWRCIADHQVTFVLEKAAAADRGHQAAKVYAIEAVWLWQKGGGKSLHEMGRVEMS